MFIGIYWYGIFCNGILSYGVLCPVTDEFIGLVNYLYNFDAEYKKYQLIKLC